MKWIQSTIAPFSDYKGKPIKVGDLFMHVQQGQFVPCVATGLGPGGTVQYYCLGKYAGKGFANNGSVKRIIKVTYDELPGKSKQKLKELIKNETVEYYGDTGS